MYSTDISNNEDDLPNSDGQRNKRRRKKSMVWDHFTVQTVNSDCMRALCNQCKKSFAYISGTKLAGTSHLKRHIALGICPMTRHNQEINQQSQDTTPAPRTNISSNGTTLPRKRHRAPNVLSNIISGYKHGDELAKMIIQHDYPLNMVEQSGFIDFTRALQPQFSVSSVSTVEEQIMGVYVREKQKVLHLLSGIPGRVSLTVDLWTSNQSLAYVLLTGHFIDQDFRLQRRALSFVRVPFPDSDTSLNHAIASCLTDWSCEDKLFTVTVERSIVSEKAEENIRNLLSIKNRRIPNRQLLVSGCYSCILRSLAQDAIGSMWGTIEKVRLSVKYVKTSIVLEERFIQLKQQLQVPSMKTLMIDDLAKWNTTYQMLIAASELKEVFSCLDTCDPCYSLIPSMEEWRQVEILCKYLKIFYEAANHLTSSDYPTTNWFFESAWNVYVQLMNGAVDPDFSVSSLTRPLCEKFAKFWDDCYLVMAVAVVMDPRLKMQYVEFTFRTGYGEHAETYAKIVQESLTELYLEYFVQSLPPPTFIDGEAEGDDILIKTEEPQESDLPQEEDDILSNGVCAFTGFDIFLSDDFMSEQMKSELEQYLEGTCLPRTQDFDVLGWWRDKKSKYPTLSKLAFEVLSIPVSTRCGESVFDTRERKMDSYRSSLSPDIVQALVCAKDWLQYESTTQVVPLRYPRETFDVKTEL